MIIRRYIAAEITKTTLGVILILLFIGLSNEFVVYLTKAASGELPAKFVLMLAGYSVPILLGVLIPISFFIGILMAYGRMYADSEMNVLIACGLSPWQLMKIAMIPAIGFIVLSAALNLWFNPIAITQQQTLIAQAQTDLVSRALLPGRFQETEDGKTILFVEQVTPDRTVIENIFIAQQPGVLTIGGTEDEWSVVVSQQGFEWFDQETGQDYIVLTNGARYGGVPGQADFSITTFGEYGIQFQTTGFQFDPESESRSTMELLRSQNIEDKLELNWRIALVVALLVVVVLAVPLSYIKPRAGKYSNLFIGVLVIIVYCNILVIGRSWLREGVMPLSLGFWWVHGIALVVGLLLTLFRLGYHRRLIRRQS